MQGNEGFGGRGGGRDGSFAPNPYGPAGGQGGPGAPGSSVGRGPRGYRRSDDRIRDASGDRVVLVLAAREVHAQGWPYPEILGVRNAGYSIP